MTILRQIQQLTPEQGRTFDKIVFWFFFLYMEVWAYVAVAPDLLAGVGIATLVVLLLRKREVGRCASFFVLHVALLASLAYAIVVAMDVVVIVDFTVLAGLTVRELTHRSRALLIAIAVEHILGLVISPWSQVSLMKDSAAVAAHAVARALAVIMVLFIAARMRPSTVESSPQAAAPEKPRRRPLTVAQWEAKNGGK